MRRILWLAPFGILIVLGCSITTRERLKHFFFEVETTPVAQAPGATDEAQPPATEIPALPEPAQRFASVHPPVRDRQCATCHDQDNQMQVDDDAYAEACAKCHPRFFGEEATHDPVTEGACRDCHEPHRSKYAFLQREPVLQLCSACHDEPDDLSEESHSGSDAANCCKCHDAHFGEAPFLKEKPPQGD